MADVRIPESGAYRLARARVPVCLATAQLSPDGDGLALVDIAVDDGRIRSSLRRRSPAPARSTSPAAWSSRLSSTATPISTRAISGRASRIRTAPSLPRSMRSRATGRRAGAPRTWRGGWISRSAPPTRTAPRRSAPISIRCRRRRRSPGRCSKRCASAGPAGSSSRASRSSPSRRCATGTGSPRWPTASPRQRGCSAPSPSWCPTSTRCSTI